MTRYCSGCASEVEVADGFCLLGHPAAEGRASGSLAELRAQVDEAFTGASSAVASIVTARDVATSAGLDSPQIPKAPVSAAPPPPPPSGTVAGGGHRDVFPDATYRTDPRDPIAAFGPPPRMDWGPKRSLLRLRRADAR